jgi:hypothetical protein
MPRCGGNGGALLPRVSWWPLHQLRSGKGLSLPRHLDGRRESKASCVSDCLTRSCQCRHAVGCDGADRWARGRSREVRPAPAPRRSAPQRTPSPRRAAVARMPPPSRSSPHWPSHRLRREEEERRGDPAIPTPPSCPGRATWPTGQTAPPGKDMSDEGHHSRAGGRISPPRGCPPPTEAHAAAPSCARIPQRGSLGILAERCSAEPWSGSV